MSVRIIVGDAAKTLRTLPSSLFQTCVTSPPYYSLRDYQTDGQIGLEPTPEIYVQRLVEVFREVRRVLRDDGTLWLNLGDTRRDKQLLGIPWRTAFALQADGWWLRDDVIWSKPSCMPESVRDRCTKSHEYIFLLSKRQKYYFDAGAIAEPCSHETMSRVAKYSGTLHVVHSVRTDKDKLDYFGASGIRNKRSVWTIATTPFSGAHFATMPPELAETCIKAGSSERGQCPHCGAPWARQLEDRQQPNENAPRGKHAALDESGIHHGQNGRRGVASSFSNNPALRHPPKATLGWSQSCACPAHQPVPQVILDCFGGAGTTALVADRLQRDAVLVELSPQYAELARERISSEAGMFSSVAAE